MSEPMRDRLNIAILREEQGCGGMSQIMESDNGQFLGLILDRRIVHIQNLFEFVGRSINAHLGSGISDKDRVFVVVVPSESLPFTAERDRPVTGLRLWILYNLSSARLGDGLADINGMFFKVDILLSESDHFTPTESTIQSEIEIDLKLR